MDHDGTASSSHEGERDDLALPGEIPSLAPGRFTQLLAEIAAAPPQSLPAAPSPRVGDRLGRFLLVRKIGHGGFGVVFEAEDTDLRRRVALKMVRPQLSAAGASTPAEWMRKEAEAAAQLRHPNVVTLHDAGMWEGGTYLVYELLRGQSLADKLASGPLPREEARRVLRDVARALAHLHAAGVVHRDVKAGNVFIDGDGTVKLLDLGLAQVAGSAGTPAGSPPYAAPEQWRGERTDARADVYAWGVLAHQLLTGQLPAGPAPPGPHRPSSLRGLVAAARSAEADRRPADGGVLAAAVDQIERRRTRLLGLRFAALGLAVAALAFIVAWPTERQLARSASTSFEAYQRYSAGRRCLDRPSEGESWLRLDCERHFREALAIDPDFPLAHFELASLARWDSHPTVKIDEVLQPALRRIARLPAREQAHLRAWKAELDGDFTTAAAILRDLEKKYPDDAHVALAVGEAFYRQGRHAEAIAPLERAVALDPSLELAADELVWSLGLLDRTDDLERIAERMASSAPSAGAHHAEVQARGWIGDVEGALRIAQHAALGGGGAAREDLQDALVSAGRWEEAERTLREDVARGVERAPHRLESLLLLRGRVAEAKSFVEQQPAPADARLRYIAGARRVHRLVAARDAPAIERIFDETRAWSSELAASLAPALAYAGSVDRAEALLPQLTDPGARELTKALIAWRRQGPQAALPQLRRLARADPVSVPSMPPEAPAWLAAACAVEAEPGEAALADIRRFQRFHYPLGLWRAWAYPRSLMMEARLLTALGRRDEAETALDKLDAVLARADPDLPLLTEARTLRRRLGAAASIAGEVSGGRRP